MQHECHVAYVSVYRNIRCAAISGIHIIVLDVNYSRFG